MPTTLRLSNVMRVIDISRKPLDTYLCSYFLPSDQAQLYFKCEATDTSHAEEQLMDAEPNAPSIFCKIFSRGGSHA